MPRSRPAAGEPTTAHAGTRHSTYVMFGFTKDLIVGWRSRAVDGVWLTSSKKPVLHQHLWQALAQAVERHTVRWYPVRSHTGIELNDRVDVEAVVQRDRFPLRTR